MALHQSGRLVASIITARLEPGALIQTNDVVVVVGFFCTPFVGKNLTKHPMPATNSTLYFGKEVPYSKMRMRRYKRKIFPYPPIPDIDD